MDYSDQLIDAIGEWQNGWREDGARRLAITHRLREAIASSTLPENVLRCREICYRKRFLVPNNPQNGGDLKQLIFNGRIEEGVASWATDFDCAKTFKEPTRPNNVSAIFSYLPPKDEVVINIKSLWSDPEFVHAVSIYAAGGGRFAGALQNFKALQHEVILDTPLHAYQIEAFCGRISDVEHLYDVAGQVTEAQQDEFWRRMVDASVYPGDTRWLNRAQSHRALDNVRTAYMHLQR